MRFIEIYVPQEYFFTGEKTVVETISVVITDSSNVHCFDLYLINIFMKSMKAERCRDMFNLTLYIYLILL